jgi:nitroimidazol reductase NimA-like FMN-containing flavoprotein (pyridoxamine 5'-phosphate oxidase superfamily)
MMPESFDVTPLNQVKRVPKRGSYDHESVFQVIDAAWIAHIGILSPPSAALTVIPMLHARLDDCLIFHGARSSRMMKYLASGERLCVSFAITDGLVLAKSLFHHSMNYRSAVVFGAGKSIDDEAEIINALKAISDKIMPGRWDDARQPSEKELSATALVKVKIDSASAKIRSGDPVDDEADLELPYWSGVLPIREQFGNPITDQNSTHLPVPDYIKVLKSEHNRNSSGQ